MGVIATVNLRASRAAVERTAYQNLELFASGTADRIDQLVGDTRQSAAEVAGDAEVGAFLSGDADTRQRLDATVRQTLGNVVHSNADIASVMLLDRTGVCVVGTRPEDIGQSYAFRDYFQNTQTEESFTSELLT